jgi:uncharacterized protein YjdB
MSKQFKATTKLTAKFLVVLMVLQAALFALTAFGDTLPTSVTIKQGTTDVSGKTISAFVGVPLTLVATPNATVTTTAYRVNYWHSNNTTALPVGTTTTASKSFTPAAIGTGIALSVFNTTDNTGVTNSVTINVYQKLINAAYNLSGKATIDVGVTTTVYKPVLTPTTASVTSVTYASNNTTVATVDPNSGLIKAIAPGTAKITATIVAPGVADKKVFLNVTVPVPVTDIQISADGKVAAGTTLGINYGKKTTLKAMFTGMIIGTATTATKPTNVGVTWTTSNNNIAIDNKGVITLGSAAQVGDTATITAIAKDTLNGQSDSVNVTVGTQLLTIKAAKTALTVRIGTANGKQINITASPANATIPTVSGQTYTYSSSAPTIAGVTVAGVVYGVSVGKATITVTATPADGSAAKTLKISVGVLADVTIIELTAPTAASSTKPMKLYSKITIKTAVTPTASKLVARFESADPSVAYVNPYTGEVTAMGVGNTTIKATALTSGATATSNSVPVYVTDPDGLLAP